MSRVEPGYFKIGSFVLVGLALLTVGITVFGAGLFGGDRTYLETYFDESVQGLSKGSPVKYRGVQIGFVEEINFCRNKYALDPADANFEKHTRYVYTRVALYPTIFENFEDRTEVERTLADLVDRGLRTRLTSLGVTGTVYLEVDYFDVSLNPKLDVSWDPEHYYVPSSESTLLQLSESLSAILRNLEAVPFEDIGQNLDKILISIDRVANSLDVGELGNEVTATLQDFRSIVSRVQNILDDPNLDSVAGDLGATLAGARDMFDSLGPEVEEALSAVRVAGEDVSVAGKSVTDLVERSEVDATLSELPSALSRLGKALRRIDELVAHQRGTIEAILDNARAVTEDFREFSTNAKRYPSHIIFGAPPEPKEER